MRRTTDRSGSIGTRNGERDAASSIAATTISPGAASARTATLEPNIAAAAKAPVTAARYAHPCIDVTIPLEVEIAKSRVGAAGVQRSRKASDFIFRTGFMR